MYYEKGLSGIDQTESDLAGLFDFLKKLQPKVKKGSGRTIVKKAAKLTWIGQAAALVKSKKFKGILKKTGKGLTKLVKRLKPGGGGTEIVEVPASSPEPEYVPPAAGAALPSWALPVGIAAVAGIALMTIIKKRRN